jgi:hypothetical protein
MVNENIWTASKYLYIKKEDRLPPDSPPLKKFNLLRIVCQDSPPPSEGYLRNILNEINGRGTSVLTHGASYRC